MGGYERDATESDESIENDESAEGTDSTPTTGRRTPSTAKRRSVLRALGGAGALAAFAGTSAARGGTDVGASASSLADASASDAARSSAEARERARQDGEIDPTWGYPALSDDEEPPVSPDHEVELQIRPRDAPVPEFVFEPTGLSVEPGDTVRFSYESPHHTVTAYHPAFGYLQRVPDDVPPFSAPALPHGGYWLYTFEQEGVYDLHCAPHEIFGHAMRVVAGSPAGPGAEPLPDLCAGPGATGTVETTAEAAGETTAEATEAAEATGMTTTAPGEEGGEGGGEEEPSPPRLGAYVVLSDPALDPETVVEEGQVSWDDLAPESKQVFVRFEGFPPC